MNFKAITGLFYVIITKNIKFYFILLFVIMLSAKEFFNIFSVLYKNNFKISELFLFVYYFFILRI